MMTLNISGKDYKVKYSYNTFADTDLLERVQQMATVFDGDGGIAKVKDLFVLVRELLFVGFKKENPVESIEAVGELLDQYIDETPVNEDGEKTEQRGIFTLFTMLSEELASEGFLSDMTTAIEEVKKNNIQAIPQDHKKSTKK